MSDLIDRQAAIDTVQRYNFSFPKYMERLVTDLREAIKADLIEDLGKLPSAQPGLCEFCKHNNIADDKACLMCSAERRTDE